VKLFELNDPNVHYYGDMKILVTGGAGFIGSHLVDRLLSEGHKITVLDDLTTGSKKNMSKHAQSRSFNFVEGSVLNSDLVADLVAKTDYVFHLAAAVGVFNIVNKPLESLLTNVRGTENLLFFANQFRIPILITSSSEVYGKNTSDTLRESDDRILGSPLTLRWSYSEAKAIDESLAFAYFVEKKLETRIVRFFNTVGSRQLGSYGMVLPRFIEAALSNTPITIYGSGNQTRCFAHVSDVVEALTRVAFSSNTIGKVINIGNNVEISMTDLAKRIIERTNSTSELIYVPYKDAYGDGFEDMERRVPNIDLINELVGWSPRLDLDEIIDEIIANSTKTYSEQTP
jgi:UDP-glucose 4-epimerase